MNWLLHRFNVFDKKSHKEKVYREYKLDVNSSKRDLKDVRKQIRRQIRDERLHPDNWPSDMKQKDEPKRMEKFLWLKAIMDLLQEDIDRGYVVFDNEEAEKEKQKIINKYIELPKQSRRKYFSSSDDATIPLLSTSDGDDEKEDLPQNYSRRHHPVILKRASKTKRKKHEEKFMDPQEWEIVIETMASSIPPKNQLRAFEKLRKMAEKLTTKSKQKYKTLYLNDPKLKRTVLNFDGGLEFLYNLGFEQDLNTGNRLICHHVNNEVAKACLICLEHIAKKRLRRKMNSIM